MHVLLKLTYVLTIKNSSECAGDYDEAETSMGSITLKKYLLRSMQILEVCLRLLFSKGVE